MKPKKVSWFYKAIKKLLKWVYPKFEAVNTENLPDEPCIIVGNHSQMYGPIVCELFFPIKRQTWCVGKMMEVKEIPAYSMEDFWPHKPKSSRWFYKMLGYVIAWPAAFIFKNADTIGVYSDTRIMSTFKKTVAALDDGCSVVIFPEKHQPYNNILCQFQQNFADVARIYHKKTGKQLKFVPMYIAPKLKKFYFGNPVQYNANQQADTEKQRICQYVMDQITAIAASLPEHTVVPYENIPKKQYPKNKI